MGDRLSLRRYIGYDLDEEVPEHSTLSKARDLLGRELFQEVFDYSVHLYQAAGMVGGVHSEGGATVNACRDRAGQGKGKAERSNATHAVGRTLTPPR